MVPHGSLPLLSALHLSGKIPVPVPHPAAHLLAELLWSSGLGVAPGPFVDYARYLFVADGEKARRELGFAARHGSREALEAYQAWRHPRSARRPVEVTA